MNTETVIQMLTANGTIARSHAEIMVADWVAMGLRHHNGKPVTRESIRKIARPTRLAIKAQRNAGRTGTSLLIQIAKRRHPHGIA